MKVFAFACIIFAICISTSLQRTRYYQCYDGDTAIPIPLWVHVDGCESFPCYFKENSNLVAFWYFAAQNRVKKLKTEVNIIMQKNTFPYPWGTDQQGCASLSKGKCPLKPADVATYNMTMHLFVLTPKAIPFWFEFRLLDQKKRVQMCFQLWSRFL